MGWLKKALIIGGLAVWYTFTGPSDEYLKNKKEYPLPDEIKVVATTLPHEVREKVWTSIDPNGKEEERIELEKIVKTADIDFSKDFKIKTERYRLVKDDDWLPSRMVGHILSLPVKLYFLDWQVSWGLDADKTRAVLSMLENNKNIKDLTVRINHNEAIYDCYRLFGDEKVEKRNNWFARALMGVPTSIAGELFAELRRGDYYNPMNQTIVLYSNVESISGHEIGHHQDFQRFTSDWEYELAGIFPPVTLYKEWQASQNSKRSLTSEDNWQFNRYLLPAFFTYLLAGYYVSRKLLQRSALKAAGDDIDLDELEKDERPEIHPLQTLRHFGTLNLDLYVGLAAYHICESANAPELLGYAGFAVGLIATDELADTILKRIIPYEHE